MQAQLDQQVEKIIDEGTGAKRSVIVRMASTDEEISILSGTASEAIQKRKLVQSARDVLPLPFDNINLPPSGERSAYMQRKLRSVDQSVVAQVAALNQSDVTSEGLKSSSLDNMKPLMKSNIVQTSISESRRQKKDANVLWISNSLVVELSKDNLAKLPDEVPGIEGIYPNRTLSLPPVSEAMQTPKAVEENKTSAWGVEMVGALSAWGAYGARGSGVKIGLLDTGVDSEHPDLVGKVSDWAEFDRNGQEVANSVPHDSDEHGTHCAGTIAGGNASGRWIGVAPEAELAAGLVLKGGRGTDAQILAGIQWAANLGVDVISMSLGGVWFDPEVRDDYMNTFISCSRLGIPVVIAIGNSGNQTTGTPGNDFFSFSVGATDFKDSNAGFSGGRTHVVTKSQIIPKKYLPLVYSKPDVSAPGVGVLSSTPNEGWKSFNGTSMATPHVAGAIALLLSATSISTNVKKSDRAYLIQDLLIGSVDELGESGQDHRYGFGRINVLRAIGFAKERGY